MPPKPADLPIPPGVLDLLPVWFDEWKTAGITLVPDSFTASWTERIRPETYKLDPDAEWMIYRRPFFIFSPDSSKAIDPFSTYELTLEKGRPVIAGRDVDSAVNVLDWSRGIGFQTLSCGTPCNYHDGAWVDETMFIIVGADYFMPGDGPNRGTIEVIAPALSIVSLRDSVRTSYFGPFVPVDTFSKARIARYVSMKLDPLFPD